ncbi:helix-turn-helix domain-containing protein [Aerococcaceae bacterium NML190073]|nr:helix-turn-helix domain-containing protein [Aerococcaceae bacterium NML190073]
MSEFGSYLKTQRDNKGLSLAKVHESTGITNSRLSRAENGADGILNPAEIKKLAALYGVAVVPMYLMAGYLDYSDLEEYRSGFKNTDLLDADEKKHIQDQIDFHIKKKGQLQ